MASPRKRLLSCALIAAAVAAACGPADPPKTPAPAVADRCPDLSKADDVAAFDYAAEYGVSREAGDRIKAAALASLELEALAERLDADLGIACAQIVHDLGKGGDYHTGVDACTAAANRVAETRAKLGPKAQTQLVVRKPTCLLDTSLVTKCASLCDSAVPSEKAKSECTSNAGRCDGTCDGTCEPKGLAKCDGTCAGTCDGVIKGTCGGRCVGTCDGKKVNGACLGVCIGTCANAATEAECKGLCMGVCKLAKPGICGDGICAGTCSLELAEAKCVGGFKPPEVSVDCRTRCDLAVMNKTECSLPQVGYVIAGTNAKEAEAMKAAIDKAFPPLLNILAEVGEQGATRVEAAQKLIDETRAGFGQLAAGKNAAAARAQLEKCFAAPFKKASASAATAKETIGLALGVRDEATSPSEPAKPPAP